MVEVSQVATSAWTDKHEGLDPDPDGILLEPLGLSVTQNGNVGHLFSNADICLLLIQD